jgi:hypothetical protein
MTDTTTTVPRAESPTTQWSSFINRYRADADFAKRHREKVNAAYRSMPEGKKVELIAKKTAKYFDSPKIQERQRRTSREYYHQKKAAL